MRRGLCACSLGLALGTWGECRAEEPESIPSGDASEEMEASEAERLRAFRAPPSCIDIEALRTAVDAQLQSELEVAREVEGEMIRGPAGWIVTFTVYEGDERIGERLLELQGDDCRTHDETLALVSALLLEHGPPPKQEVEPAPPPAESPAAEPAPIVEEKEAAPAAPAEPEPSLVRLRAGVGLRMASGWLPAVGWGTTAFWGAEFLGWSAIDVVGDFYFPQTEAAAAGSSIRASGGRAHLRACALPRWNGWGASLCPGLGWIALAASGKDVPDAQAVFASSFEAGISGSLIWQAGDAWGLELGADALFPFSRGRFVLESPAGDLQVHETRSFLLLSHVGLVLTL